MQATFKVFDIARDRRKILEKEIEKRKIKSKNNIFLLLLFYMEKFIYSVRKLYLEKLCLYCYICVTVFSRGPLLEI